MHKPTAVNSAQGSTDIGTLWTMRRNDRTARCALLSWRGTFEVRVLVEGETVLTERCDRAEEAFGRADGWKRRMTDKGWRCVGR